MYKCVCGREFTSSQSLNGHKGHCKVYLGEEKYNNIKEIIISNQRLASKAFAKKQLEESDRKNQEREEYISKWITEGHTCETCGKVMTEYYGSGRFCCRSCSNKYVSRNRPPEAVEACVKAGAKNLVSGWKKRGKSGFASLSHERRSEIMKEVANRPEHKKRFLETCIPASHTPEVNARTSARQKQAYIDGKNEGWKTRSNVRTKYEIYWDKVLTDLNIPHIQEYTITKKNLGIKGNGYYRLDFYIPNGKIDLELDGKQHNYQDRIEHDENRTKALESNGFHVYRIRNVDPDLYPDEANDQINKFMRWYENILLSIK